MMTFKMTPTNRNQLMLIANLGRDFKNGLRKGLQQSGVEIAGKAGKANDGAIKQDMNKPKTGRIYKVSYGRHGVVLKKARLHQASAPGQSPAVISGQLRDSVYYRVEGSNQLRIGANTPYARTLEEGGYNKNGARIAARNYLRRPILAARRNIINNIKNSIDSGIKK